jgi:hypothetical protein
MDDSADEKRQKVFVVAGFIGDTEEWFEVERHWNARLERDGLAYFRATEHNSLTGEFLKLVKAYGPHKAREIATNLISDLKGIIKSGSEREFVELPNWRGLGMAAAPATETEASAWSVAR